MRGEGRRGEKEDGISKNTDLGEGRSVTWMKGKAKDTSGKGDRGKGHWWEEWQRQRTLVGRMAEQVLVATGGKAETVCDQGADG
ncbi:hypothetical protein Pmani_032632 [Petrolisthes manimaculis]|uniref:Uncharacterized protein n=1 Tax=Petrolisthes manimaculis TaxID=1843537 RepID=A0AAE1NT88_9EUCA|nr:hypothetical protein Pmani_032632 [Petrolisthes manimaculis]